MSRVGFVGLQAIGDRVPDDPGSGIVPRVETGTLTFTVGGRRWPSGASSSRSASSARP